MEKQLLSLLVCAHSLPWLINCFVALFFFGGCLLGSPDPAATRVHVLPFLRFDKEAIPCKMSNDALLLPLMIGL